MLEICNRFKISDQEFYELDKKFGKLCWHAAHELKKKNCKNNYTDDPEDIKQELQMSMLRAGSYYKRQVYIEKCIQVAKKHCFDYFFSRLLKELDRLWKNRTRHGANRQKFGPYQELILEKIVRACVPSQLRPNRHQSLNIDSKFTTYCKAIVWNGQKSMGKKITREKGIRSGMVSISEYDYLANS